MIRFILLNLYLVKRAAWKIIWHSVYFFLVRPRRIAIAGIVGLALSVGFALYQAPSSDTRIAPAPQSAQTPSGHITEVSILPAITGATQDGNSWFTKPLYGRMSKDAKRYYSHAFHRAMESSGKPRFAWLAPGSQLFGSFSMTSPYSTKAGTVCRDFRELTNHGEFAESFNGTACKRGDGKGWCRLRPNSTPSCALEYGGPDAMEKWRHMKRTFKHMSIF